MSDKFWAVRRKRALEKKLARSIDLLRTNIDWQIKYPQEAKNPGKHIHKSAKIDTKTKQHIDNYDVHEPNPTIAKMITEEVLRIQKTSMTPAVDRPRRLNKVVE